MTEAELQKEAAANPKGFFLAAETALSGMIRAYKGPKKTPEEREASHQRTLEIIQELEAAGF